MHEFQQIGVLTFSRPQNYTRWVVLGLFLILIAFLLFAALGESKPSKTLSKPKTTNPVSSTIKKE